MSSALKAKNGKSTMTKYSQIFILTLLVYWLAGCAPSMAELAEENPEMVIAREKELLTGEPPSEEIIAVLINAHNNLGLTSLKGKDYKEAERQFNASLTLDHKNKIAKYGLAMIEGHRLFNKGSQSALWDSLEKFGQAAYYNPADGEPHYWMARAYEKKDDGDFDLIIETYEKALKGDLSYELKTDTNTRLAEIKKRKKTYEDFWK